LLRTIGLLVNIDRTALGLGPVDIRNAIVAIELTGVLRALCDT
jgi:hypothetical protein